MDKQQSKAPLAAAWVVRFRYGHGKKPVGEWRNGIALGAGIDDAHMIIDCETGDVIKHNELWDFHASLRDGCVTFTVLFPPYQKWGKIRRITGLE